MRDEIERLLREKKTLENHEKIVKRILNIEEEHRKHCSLIAGGVRKLFAIRIKEQKYKEAVAQDYAKNIAGLRDIIGKRKKEKEVLARELEEKRAKIYGLRAENDARNREYGELEDELFKQKRT